MRIGEVAAEAGVNIQTLRYYERRRLLPEPARSNSGYRTYDPGTVRLVRFIKRAQELGFTLREIEDLIELRQTPRRGAEVRHPMAGAKAARNDSRRAAMTPLWSCASSNGPGPACFPVGPICRCK
jgi:DNA-binding transcriptional MerR regulator